MSDDERERAHVLPALYAALRAPIPSSFTPTPSGLFVRGAARRGAPERSACPLTPPLCCSMLPTDNAFALFVCALQPLLALSCRSCRSCQRPRQPFPSSREDRLRQSPFPYRVRRHSRRQSETMETFRVTFLLCRTSRGNFGGSFRAEASDGKLPLGLCKCRFNGLARPLIPDE